MTLASVCSFDVAALEERLEHASNPLDRLGLIEQLASYYVFANVQRSRQLLNEQERILLRHPQEDYLSRFYIHRAILENQAYQYGLADLYFQKAIRLIEDNGDARIQAETYIDYTGTCINNKRMDEASAYLEKARRLLRIYPNPKLEARITCREGFVQLHYSNFSRAIELLLEADRQIMAVRDEPLEIKDYYFLVLIHSGLGNIHERNDDLDSSVKAYLRAASTAESLGLWNRMSWIYLNIGNGYVSMGKYGQAAAFFTKAVRLHEDFHPVSKASAYANLGFCSLMRKNYPKALHLLEKAEAILDQVEDPTYKNYALIESWRGLVYARLGEVEKAETHFLEAITWARIEDDYKRLSSVFQDMAAFYAEQNDYRRAYEYQVMHSQHAARYNQEVNLRKRTELEYKYEAEQKQQEAEMLRLQATRLQMKALRAQMNPHFIFNALNSIQHYITSYETDSASKYLAMFAKLMRQSLDYSDLEIISLDKEVEFLRDYLLINQKLRFNNGLQYEVILEEEIEEDIFGVPTMIVQPYVENAIEHGLRTKSEGMIRLRFSLYDENTLLCVVEDNGIGRENARKFQQQDPKFHKHLSRGTSITEQRLQLLATSKKDRVFVKTIDMKDENGSPCGTRVEIKIPIMDLPLNN
ncbi:MAG: tetratricopeptide repeat protein [Haliscomenobacter sp.]|nr:tetratricopeptide repeat protein [Haliscomenobacter sp.]